MDVLLIDLPTFPKGLATLSLAVVAGMLDDHFKVRIIDLNLDSFHFDKFKNTEMAFLGLKVSSQNIELAMDLTLQLKSHFGKTPIVWGGEFPSLMPDESLLYADAIVMGSFDQSLQDFVTDLKGSHLQRKYGPRDGSSLDQRGGKRHPRLDLLPHLDRYYSFMGIPLETSKGCDRKCTFCMVHVMQKQHSLQEKNFLQAQLAQDYFKNRLVNIIDYNLGVDRDHLFMVADLLAQSQALGWTAEMCIERLDDEELLQRLQRSRCKIIYCGLESIDEGALKSVNKSRTNQVKEYERIIRKVQSYGINVGVGVILGLQGSTVATFHRLNDFFQRLNVVYVKLTFLTFNPGTKVKQSMLRKGDYVTSDLKKYDGQHLTFKVADIDAEAVFQGAKFLISQMYSIRGIVKRIWPLKMNFFLKMEFLIYAYCFGEVYRDWLKFEILTLEQNSMDELVRKKFKKSAMIKWSELLLKFMRTIQLGFCGFLFFISSSSIATTISSKINYELPSVKEFSRSARGRQILQCAQCHQKQFDNWLQGPHAFSYKAIEYVLKTAETKEYLQYMHDKQEKVCLKCHTPSNVFEGIYKGADEAPSLDQFFNRRNVFFHNSVRKEGRETGVDCITCHVQGNQVITRADFVPNPKIKKTKDHCNPKPSKTYSSMYNCLACHEDSMDEMKMHMKQKQFAHVKNCLQCHQEYDQHGRGTHYIFWNKDDGTKRRPDLLGGFMRGVLINVLQKKGQPYLSVTLHNRVFPHKLYVCPETIFELKVLREDESLAFNKIIRFNRKQFQDPKTRKYYPNSKIPGEYGHDFDPGAPPLVQDFPIQNKVGNKGFIEIVIKKKTHYWDEDEDSITVQKIRKKYSL